MFLKEIQLKNFRGIEQLTVPLDDICVLIGENNSGKSTVLDALRICLTRSLTRRGSVFEEYDYHLNAHGAEPSKASPIEITLTFSERTENEWPDEISQILADAEQVDDAGLRSVILRVTSGYDPAISDFATDYNFLDLSGNPLVKAKNPRTLIGLQQLVPTFYLASLRDAGQEFRARSQFWGPFVRALSLDDATRKELEDALAELNTKVLAEHKAFDKVKERLQKTADLMPLGGTDPISIEALPSKMFDILSRAQVTLSAKTGAKIPIMRHGNGTQSLAVICLFDAFLQSRLEDSYGPHAQPLLALEEPEAHLHPAAIKAVGDMLQGLSGQKVITTHSGDLLAGVPLTKVRRLRRSNGAICVHQLNQGVLTADEINKLDYQIRANRGSLLFSRCWLLVEGETEAPFLAEVARAMSLDLYADGISCIEYSQVGVEKFIKLADALGIEWFVLADNDTEGRKYVTSAKNHLNGRAAADHIRLLDHGHMEVFLSVEGFGHIYEATVSAQKKNTVTAPQGTTDYWKQVANAQAKNTKTKNSLAVADAMIRQGPQVVPQLLQDVINQARTLARRAA